MGKTQYGQIFTNFTTIANSLKTSDLGFSIINKGWNICQLRPILTIKSMNIKKMLHDFLL